MKRAIVLVLFFLAVSAAIQGQQPAADVAPVSPSSTARQILGPPAGVPLSGDALETQAQHVGSLLRCPVCQGLSIDDSPAPMARNMSREVRDLLAAGYDQEQVLKYFEASYGEFVLLQPPLRGVNWLVWLAPGLALLLGGVAVYFALKRMSRGNEAVAAGVAPSPLEAEEPDDPEMEPYLQMVRGLARDEGSPSRADGKKGT